MAEYRAYVIGADGHFIRVVELVCTDDETAKEYIPRFIDSPKNRLPWGDFWIRHGA